MRKVIEEMADEITKSIQVLAINCERLKSHCDRFGVPRTPMLMLMSAEGDDMELRDLPSGTTSKTIIEWIDRKTQLKQMTTNDIRKLIDRSVGKPVLIGLAPSPSEIPFTLRKAIFENKDIVFALASPKDKALLTSILENTPASNLESVQNAVSALREKLLKKSAVPTAGALPLAVLVVNDPDALTGEWLQLAGAGLSSVNLLNIVMQQVVRTSKMDSGIFGRAQFRKLTLRRYSAGECNETDSQYCFILFSWGEMPKFLKDAAEDVARKFATDPVRVVHVDCKEQKSFASSFNLPPHCEKDKLCVVAYRPKRKRYDIFETSVPFSQFTKEEAARKIREFIESRVDGGAPLRLSMQHALHPLR
eukprot:GHVO01063430.1.p1 GENE.GHVO01063430.1~~GHVO01063430.1.p1  ORF type:complete len:363 (-),score=41.42 GHVO01063430.1:224-1312(-)